MTAFDAKTPDQSLTSDLMTPDALLHGMSRLFAAARWRTADLLLYQNGREHQLRCFGIKTIMNMRDMPTIVGMPRHIVGDRCCTSASTNL
ncbi:hypothetical protein [Afipia sp. GAS231]|uniref:hypothetical protein n=1 Tax=Afipia sp. GAS231 TaxID=1882747 RepID=UPI000B89F390|nr:hypothetical protein [Afipia sp. GAS231]